MSETRHIDQDGRVDRRTALADSSLEPLWAQKLSPGQTAAGLGGGLDSVYRTVTTASGTYEYATATGSSALRAARLRPAAGQLRQPASLGLLVGSLGLTARP